MCRLASPAMCGRHPRVTNPLLLAFALATIIGTGGSLLVVVGTQGMSGYETIGSLIPQFVQVNLLFLVSAASRAWSQL